MKDKDKKSTVGCTVWITGLPYTGKKETGRILAERLKSLGYKTQVLVGGEIRRQFEKDLGWSALETAKNIRRIAFECKLLSESDVIAIAVTISPYKKLREECRSLIGRFVEVFHTASLEALKKRDTKELFERAERGELKNVAGISFPYEESVAPELVIHADREIPFEAAGRIILKLLELGYLREEDRSVLLEQEEKAILRILRETWFK